MSEQANNRRGAGWLGVGTLTAAEAGPWTESNLERAVRGGPMGDDVLSAGKNGRDPDSEAKIHALALDVARAGICTYAEARAHVEAMLARRMERLDAGQVREAFERAVGPCPTPDEADRLYGRGSDLALRIRAAWEVSPRGADGAILAPEMVTERTGPASKRPSPAQGQVWLPPPSVGWAETDGTLTLDRLLPGDDGGLSRIRWTNGATCAASMVTAPGGGWTCIGVATPHGRVMVGDGFAGHGPGAPDAEVVAIGTGDSVLLRSPNGWEAWVNAVRMADPRGGQRTSYAPARAGERFRAGGGYCDDWTIDAYDVGRVFDAAAYERLDPGQGGAAQGKPGAVAREDAEAVLRQMSTGIGPRYVLAPTEGAAVAEPDAALRDRCITADWRRAYRAHGPDTATGAALDALAATMGVERRGTSRPSGIALDSRGNAYDVTPRTAVQPLTTASAVLGQSFPERYGPPSLTLQAPAPQLRALFDTIGRALELPATRHACSFGAGLTVTVLRDEMLFTPTATTGIGTADLAGDARALCALRSAVSEAMATGRGSLPQWGAKGPCVEVQREGGAAVADVAHEASEAPRYTPSEGGAGAWRWETGK